MVRLEVGRVGEGGSLGGGDLDGSCDVLAVLHFPDTCGGRGEKYPCMA